MATQIKVEDVSSVQKKFLVTIPANVVAQTVEKKVFEVQKTAKLKGFRPGKVPLNLVKQYYGEDIKSRALNTLISTTYGEALDQHSVRVVGEPKIEGNPDKEHLHIHDGEDLSYVATVEIIPEISVKDYKGLSLEKPTEEVTEADLAEVKKNLQERRAEFVPVERAAKTGDFVDFKFEGKMKNDKGEWETPASLSGDRTAEIGSGQLLPEFEKNIQGMKAGDTKTFTMKYADDYSDQALAGKSADYEVTLREVKEKKLPEFDDAMAKDFGYQDLADFTKVNQERLKETKKEESENALRNQMIEKLIEKNSFEVPQALVYSQIRALMDDYARELKQYGFNDQMIQSAVIRQLEDFKKRAETQVRAGLLLDAIAKKEEIKVTEADLNAEMEKSAARFGMTVKELKKRFDQNSRDAANFEFRVREELTIQLILNAAKIKKA